MHTWDKIVGENFYVKHHILNFFDHALQSINYNTCDIFVCIY